MNPRRHSPTKIQMTRRIVMLERSQSVLLEGLKELMTRQVSLLKLAADLANKAGMIPTGSTVGFDEDHQIRFLVPKELSPTPLELGND